MASKKIQYKENYGITSNSATTLMHWLPTCDCDAGVGCLAFFRGLRKFLINNTQSKILTPNNTYDCYFRQYFKLFIDVCLMVIIIKSATKILL